jgi:hypothetical protein
VVLEIIIIAETQMAQRQSGALWTRIKTRTDGIIAIQKSTMILKSAQAPAVVDIEGNKTTLSMATNARTGVCRSDSTSQSTTQVKALRVTSVEIQMATKIYGASQKILSRNGVGASH